jgi:hypothetical protein
MKVKPM